VFEDGVDKWHSRVQRWYEGASSDVLKGRPDEPGDVDYLQERGHLALRMKQVAQPLEPVIRDVHPRLIENQQRQISDEAVHPACYSGGTHDAL